MVSLIRPSLVDHPPPKLGKEKENLPKFFWGSDFRKEPPFSLEIITEICPVHLLMMVD